MNSQIPAELLQRLIQKGFDNTLSSIADVIMWIHENLDIWIEVRHIKTYGVNRFYFILWDYNDRDYYTIHDHDNIGYKVWDTPTEAYLAAIEYFEEYF